MGSRFCTDCGAVVFVAPAEESPRLVLRPVFVPGPVIATMAPIMLILAAILGVAVGSMLSKWLPQLVTTVVAIAVLFKALMFFGFATSRRLYASMTWTFYADRVDYFKGSWSVVEKSVPLNEVLEVELQRGALQRKHGLGTICLATPASAARPSAGVQIFDVEDSEAAYREIRALVDGAQRALAA